MAKRKKTKRATRKRKVRGLKSPIKTSGSTVDRVLASMSAYREELISQRSELEMQIESIENAMRQMGGAAVSARSRPSRGSSNGAAAIPGIRAGSLKDHIVRVLRDNGGTMSIQEIVAGVLAAGYKTKSDDLTNAVNNALGQLKMIRRVSRGQYSA